MITWHDRSTHSGRSGQVFASRWFALTRIRTFDIRFVQINLCTFSRGRFYMALALASSSPNNSQGFSRNVLEAIKYM